MNQEDIRYKQRFENYKKALVRLTSAVALMNERGLSDLEQQGLIQAFEYTHELAWNTMKDYLHFQGEFDIKGSRDATRSAFKVGLISNGDVWLEMIQARNLTSHAYDEKMVTNAVALIVERYMPLFIEFKGVMSAI